MYRPSGIRAFESIGTQTSIPKLEKSIKNPRNTKKNNENPMRMRTLKRTKCATTTEGRDGIGQLITCNWQNYCWNDYKWMVALQWIQNKGKIILLMMGSILKNKFWVQSGSNFEWMYKTTWWNHLRPWFWPYMVDHFKITENNPRLSWINLSTHVEFPHYLLCISPSDDVIQVEWICKSILHFSSVWNPNEGVL